MPMTSFLIREPQASLLSVGMDRYGLCIVEKRGSICNKNMVNLFESERHIYLIAFDFLQQWGLCPSCCPASTGKINREVYAENGNRSQRARNQNEAGKDKKLFIRIKTLISSIVLEVWSLCFDPHVFPFFDALKLLQLHTVAFMFW